MSLGIYRQFLCMHDDLQYARFFVQWLCRQISPGYDPHCPESLTMRLKARPIMRQNTDWGYIDWEYLPDPGNPKRWFSVGRTTVLPGRRQPPHVHYGYEQFLYVLSGEADATFNGFSSHLKKGDYFILDADTMHEAVNNGDTPYTEIVVTNPIPREAGEHQRTGVSPVSLQSDPATEAANRRKLNTAAENLKTNLLQNVSIPFCLFDAFENVILKNDRYPSYCLHKCDPVNAPKSCACFCRAISDSGLGESRSIITYICPHGIKLYLLPVVHKGMVIGILRGGHHFSSAVPSESANIPADIPADEYYDTPYATEISIEKTLLRIISSLQRYCDILDSMEALASQKEELNGFMQKTSELEQSLSTVEEKVTNLKIDHHFLFNTLNCLADMSLTGERMDLYQSIIDLSKMFRYTMVQTAQIVPLSQEIEYLKSYLNLQKLRYGKDLSLSYSIAPECASTPVPFNFLQPIAENAFTHAFKQFDKPKKVSVRVSRGKGRTIIRISNNGNPPAVEDVNRISLSWASGSGHGLSFIYDKLKNCFGSDFEMKLNVTKQKQTHVTVSLPDH